ncbi:MAG: hypothetical protein CVU26_04160, partial [Betaproteobacteria bacterium HGW-Betaproteobacteria-2]
MRAETAEVTDMIHYAKHCSWGRICSYLLLALSGALAACSVTPGTIVQTPTTAKPVPADRAAAPNGAIYRAAAYKPLFEDRR